MAAIMYMYMFGKTISPRLTRYRWKAQWFYLSTTVAQAAHGVSWDLSGQYFGWSDQCISNGGHANFSGIEIWTAGPPPPNQPPVVANAIGIRMRLRGCQLVMYFRPILFQILMLAQRLPIRHNGR